MGFWEVGFWFGGVWGLIIGSRMSDSLLEIGRGETSLLHFHLPGRVGAVNLHMFFSSVVVASFGYQRNKREGKKERKKQQTKRKKKRKSERERFGGVPG